MGLDDWSNAQLLTAAARAMQRQATEYLKVLGLPRLGLYILEYLTERSPLLQSELAALVLARTQTIGRVLTRLESERWITRQYGPIHNQVAVTITDKGRAILAVAQDRLRALQPDADVEALRPALLAIIRRAARPQGRHPVSFPLPNPSSWTSGAAEQRFSCSDRR